MFVSDCPRYQIDTQRNYHPIQIGSQLMDMSEFKAAVNNLPDDLEVFFQVPDLMSEIIRNRGRMPVSTIKIAPADFGQLVLIQGNSY
jgi:hypothetical protein